MDDALRRTSAAAQRYVVSEAFVERATLVLAGHTGSSRHLYTTGYLHANLLDMAEIHKTACDQQICATCDAIGRMIAMMLAFTRAELNDEFREHLAAPAAPRRRWRRFWA